MRRLEPNGWLFAIMILLLLFALAFLLAVIFEWIFPAKENRFTDRSVGICTARTCAIGVPPNC
jgi:hypothetical protein